MKTKLLFLLFVLLGIQTVYGQENSVTQLRIWNWNGASAVFLLDENPQITYKKDLVIIKSSYMETFYPLSTVRKITYESSPITDIEESEAIKNVEYKNGGILFPNVNGDGELAVFTVTGKLMFKDNLKRNVPYFLSLQSYPKGIYLIKYNQLTFKITHK